MAGWRDGWMDMWRTGDDRRKTLSSEGRFKQRRMKTNP